MRILIRSIITEKSTRLAGDAKLNQYTFEVAKEANKIEIGKAVAQKFGVEVVSVNTSIIPGKHRSRVVKGKQTRGRTSSYKKAVVTIKEGQFIDGFFGQEDEALEAVEENNNIETNA